MKKKSIYILERKKLKVMMIEMITIQNSTEKFENIWKYDGCKYCIELLFHVF